MLLKSANVVIKLLVGNKKAVWSAKSRCGLESCLGIFDTWPKVINSNSIDLCPLLPPCVCNVTNAVLCLCIPDAGQLLCL